MEHLTVTEAAKALQLGMPTVKRYIYEGKLRSAGAPVVTPALVIDGTVVLSGRVPTETALEDMLARHLD